MKKVISRVLLGFTLAVGLSGCMSMGGNNNVITYESVDSYFGANVNDVCRSLRRSYTIDSLYDNRNSFYRGYSSNYRYNSYKRRGVYFNYNHLWQNRDSYNKTQTHVKRYLKRYSKFSVNKDYSSLRSCYNRYRRLY